MRIKRESSRLASKTKMTRDLRYWSMETSSSFIDQRSQQEKSQE
jgi:hypothetical protein